MPMARADNVVAIKPNKVGQIVTIYEDPLTELKPEGKAVLLEKTEMETEDAEYWIVSFEGKSDVFYRWVKKRGVL